MTSVTPTDNESIDNSTTDSYEQNQYFIPAFLADNSPASQDKAKFFSDNHEDIKDSTIVIVDENDNLELHPTVQDKGSALVFSVVIDGKEYCAIADISQSSLEQEQKSISLDRSDIENLIKESQDQETNVKINGFALCDRETSQNIDFNISLTANQGKLEIGNIDLTEPYTLKEHLDSFPDQANIMMLAEQKKKSFIAALLEEEEKKKLFQNQFFVKSGAIYPGEGNYEMKTHFVSPEAATLFQNEIQKDLSKQESKEEKRKYLTEISDNFLQIIKELEKHAETNKQTEEQSKRAKELAELEARAQHKLEHEQNIKNQQKQQKEVESDARNAEIKTRFETAKKVAIVGCVAALMIVNPAIGMVAMAASIAVKMKIDSDHKSYNEAAKDGRTAADKVAKTIKFQETAQDIKELEDHLKDAATKLVKLTQKNVENRNEAKNRNRNFDDDELCIMKKKPNSKPKKIDPIEPNPNSENKDPQLLAVDKPKGSGMSF